MTSKTSTSTLHQRILDACARVIANERFAHHLAKASVERWFAFELAAALDDGDRERVALVECGGKRGALGNIDLLLVERSQARHALRLAPPDAPWDGSAIAIEIKAAHLADGPKRCRHSLVPDLLGKPEKAKLEHPCQEWLGILITTDGGWGTKVPGGDFAKRQASMRNRQLALAPGLKAIDRVERENLRYHEWAGSAWVELVAPESAHAPA